MAADPTFIESLQLPELIKAAQYPLILTALGMPIAITAGLILALMRMSRHRFLSWPAAIYIEVVRGTPLLVQMFFVYYALPQVGEYLHTEWLTFKEPFWPAVLCLGGNYAAYEAEIHRAGLQAIEKGQREAALSIGMTERQAFMLVVLPQAVRIVIPPIINDLIAMLKDSCLASALGVPELLTVASRIGRANLEPGKFYIVASVLYMILSLACYVLGKYVESWIKVQGAPELQLEQARH